MAQLAEQFLAIAACIEARREADQLAQLLTQTHARCQQAAATARADMKELLTNVQQALQTWQQVWPRLGAQEEFRQAVARESRLWAKRFPSL